MRRTAIGALGALACAGMMTASVAAPAGAATEEDRVPAIGATANAVDSCAVSFPSDAFSKVASEADVAAGQPVAVDVTWRPAWFSGDKVDVLGCVAVNGHFVDGVVGRGVDTSSGLWVHKFAVPANAAKDAVVCQSAVVVTAEKATRSDPDCFTVTAAAAAAPAPAPDAPKPAPLKETAAAAAPAPVAPANTAPTRSAAAVAPAPKTSAAAPVPKPAAATTVPATQLPHTGAAERMLVAVAGVLLLLGGWGMAVRRPSRAGAVL